MNNVKNKKLNSHISLGNNTKKNGFTLIEMMVTVSIAAILISIAVPSFKTMFKNNRITAATNEFVAALILTRSEALKRNNNVSICTSTDQQTCTGGTDFAKGWIVFLDCDQDGVIDAGNTCDGKPEVIIKVHEGLHKLTITSNTGSKTYLNYTFSGRIRPFDNVSLDVKEGASNTGKKTISIGMSGRVKTQ